MFKEFLKIYLKKFLSSGFSFAIILLIPIVFVLIGNLSNENSLIVGLYLEENGQYEQSISSSLVNNSNVEFILFNDKEDMINQVSKSKISIAYVFNKNFTEDIKNLNVRNIITVICFRNNLYKEFTNSVVFASVFEYISVNITQDQLIEQNIFMQEDLILENRQQYQNSNNAFKIVYKMFNSKSLEIDSAYLLILYKGIICLFLIGFALIATVNLSSSKNELKLFAPYIGNLKTKIYLSFPIFLCTTASTIFSIFIAKIFASDVIIIKEIVLILIFQLTLWSLAILLSGVVNKNIIIILTPIILIFILISHPILIDVTVFLPSIKIILKFLPSYWYLIL